MEKPKEILVVDDEESIRDLCAKFLSQEGYAIQCAASAEAALELMDNSSFDLVVTDHRMPGMQGAELLRIVKERNPRTEVILMTGFGTVESAVQAMKEGAFDYVQKPINFNDFKINVRNALVKNDLQLQVDKLTTQIRAEYDFGNIVGKSPAMIEVLELVKKVCRRVINVMILGKSGTGKELVARAIHSNGPRSSGPFIPVNCASLPETLLESELFGHEKGAFTGALSRKEGYFKAADGGTLFIDEVGDIPLPIQAKLLRVIQEREFQPLGSVKPVQVDVRFICATNKNLQEAVKNQEFREDLYFRLNVVEINMPVLTTRRDDIPLMVDHFIRRNNRRDGDRIRGIDKEALALLKTYNWPGNVRELENVIERAYALADEDIIRPLDLPSELVSDARETVPNQDDLYNLTFGPAKDKVIEKFERDYLMHCIKKHLGNVTEAAKEIDVARTALQRLLKKHNIRSKEFKKNAPQTHEV